MKTLNEIKQMMVAGDTAQADEALKELLANEPDNLQAKMLYGTCRQLLGDEETFKRIYDELASVMEKLAKEEPKAETVSLWSKYQRLWEGLIVAGLIVAGTGAAIWYFGRNALDQFTCCAPALSGEGKSHEAFHNQQRRPRKFSPVNNYIEAEKNCTNKSSGKFDNGIK